MVLLLAESSQICESTPPLLLLFPRVTDIYAGLLRMLGYACRAPVEFLLLRTFEADYRLQHYIPGATPDWSADKIEGMMAEHCPLKRCAVPEDVARVVAFLASEDGGWVNGEESLSIFTVSIRLLC